MASPTVPANLPTPDATPQFQWLFNICGLLTALVWLQLVISFVKQNEAVSKTGMTTEIYLLMLTAYAGAKVLKRATPEAQDAANQRLIKGEYFIILWVLTGAVMGLIQVNGWRGMVELPHDLRTVLWGVAGIFLGTTGAKSWKSGDFKKLGEAAAPAGKSAPAPAPTPGRPSEKDAPEDPDDVEKVLDVLWKNPDGYTRAELEEATGLKRTPLTEVLHELVAKKIAVRVGKWAADPNTRYVLAQFHKLGNQG